MPSRVEVCLNASQATMIDGGGTLYDVQTPSLVRYRVYVDAGTDAFWCKSTDGGFSWTIPTAIFSGTVQALSVWYDRWSGIAAGKIHCWYSETGGHDILYRSLDTEGSDALGTQTTVFAGASVAAGGALTGWVERNGHLRCAGSIDAGAEDGAWSSTDAGATWGDTIADPSEAATQDQYLGLPGWNADTADGMIIFWDASADELSVKRYDDSGNAWAETSIAATMVDTVRTVSGPHFAAAVDLANSRNVLVAWSRVDFSTGRLRCIVIDDSSITHKTDVVSSSTDDQGLCAIAIDTVTGYWYVFYAGKTDGSETWFATVNVYYKVSKDEGTTWGAETLLTLAARSVRWMVTTPRFVGDFNLSWLIDVPRAESRMSLAVPASRARAQMGM